MKNSILTFLVVFPSVLFAQSGKVFDNLSMHSEILKMERKYAIYLPPCYETSERSYPVLYLLHGGGDDQTGWIQFGEVNRIADKAINDGKATPMIIVMPDANTKQRGYLNDVRETWRYEDFFFEELMPYVEKKFRIKSEKRYRAISGISMGGQATYIYALHHPDLFSSACPISGGLAPITIEEMEGFLEKWGVKGTKEEIRKWYENRSPLFMIENMPEEQKKAVRWYIDCGDDDYLFEGNSLVHIAMRKNLIPHEYRVRDGAHSWTYWRQSLHNVLNFVSMGFHQL